MCGIAGFADAGWQGRANGQAQARLESEFALVHRMCDVIRHRGPDDEGIHVEPGVGLGMRRLSIIDLAGGHQPIHNEDRSVWIVFNGEIYNYLELRARAREARPSVRHQQRHGDDRPRLRRVGRGRVRAAERHVRRWRSGIDPAGR